MYYYKDIIYYVCLISTKTRSQSFMLKLNKALKQKNNQSNNLAKNPITRIRNEKIANMNGSCHLEND